MGTSDSVICFQMLLLMSSLSVKVRPHPFWCPLIIILLSTEMVSFYALWFQEKCMTSLWDLWDGETVKMVRIDLNANTCVCFRNLKTQYIWTSTQPNPQCWIKSIWVSVLIQPWGLAIVNSHQLRYVVFTLIDAERPWRKDYPETRGLLFNKCRLRLVLYLALKTAAHAYIIANWSQCFSLQVSSWVIGKNPLDQLCHFYRINSFSWHTLQNKTKKSNNYTIAIIPNYICQRMMIYVELQIELT